MTPLFILASPRSFTSVLCSALGQHPAAYGVPELNLLMRDTLGELLAHATGDRQYLVHGLLRAVAQLYAGEQDLHTIDLARRWLMRRFDRSTGDVYRELCDKVGARRIVDKSPGYSRNPESLRRIAATFPDAHYLHVSRHPRAQGESMFRLRDGRLMTDDDYFDRSANPAVLDPQLAWCRTQQNIRGFLATIPEGRHRSLRGEDFVAEPARHLRALCDWLGWAADDAAVDAMLHPERSPYAAPGPVGAHLGNDPGFLASPRLKAGPVTMPLLAGALPWRRDGQGFKPDTLATAQALGYA